MKLRALNLSEWRDYLPFLKRNLEGKHLSSPILYATDTIFFHVSGREFNRFVICLDGAFPRVYLAKDPLEGSSLDNKFIANLKREIGNAYIEKIELYHEDRILKITYITMNAVFKDEEKILYVELIPHHANLIVCDKQNKIILSYRPGSMDDKRPLLKGLLYEPLPGNLKILDSTSFSLTDFNNACATLEIELSKKRKKERFGYLLTHLKNRIKLLERKLLYLQKDIENARTHLNDNLKGDAIYICYSSLDRTKNDFEYEGLKVELDPSRSLSQNAEAYYKRAKKAKETIAQCEFFLKKAKEELEDSESALLQLEVADEAGLEVMAKELKIPQQKSAKTKKESHFTTLSRDSVPYFIDFHGTKILFGKNAKQNAFLTFLFDTSKEHYWFHIQGRSGSHVIIKKDKATPEEIIAAAEICLYQSSQDDGDIIYCPRKNVRKGQVLGEAIVKEFQTIHLKKVSKEIKNLVSQARRVELK